VVGAVARLVAEVAEAAVVVARLAVEAAVLRLVAAPLEVVSPLAARAAGAPTRQWALRRAARWVRRQQGVVDRPQ